MGFGLCGIGQYQLVVVWVTPASAIITAIAEKHIEKVIGVNIVANPTGARDLIITDSLAIEIDLPLLIK